MESVIKDSLRAEITTEDFEKNLKYYGSTDHFFQLEYENQIQMRAIEKQNQAIEKQSQMLGELGEQNQKQEK